MRAVNLLPRDAQARRGLGNANPAVVAGGVLGPVVLVALGAGFATAHSRAAAERHQLAEARAVLAQVSARERASVTKAHKATKPIVPVPAVTSEEQPRLAAVSSALSTRIAWDRVLRELSLVVPSDITVSSLNMTSPLTSPGAAPPSGSGTEGVAVSGLAYSHDSVARLLARLMLIPDLENVTLASSAADPKTGEVTFLINAAVKGAPAPSAPPPAAAPAPASTTGASS